MQLTRRVQIYSFLNLNLTVSRIRQLLIENTKHLGHLKSMNFPSSLISSSRTWVAMVSTGVVVTAAISFCELRNMNESIKDKEYHDMKTPLFHSPEAPDLFHKWKHLKNEEVDLGQAFEIGRTKLPVKPTPTLFAQFFRDSALPSVFERERNLEISKLQFLFHQFVDSPGYAIMKKNLDNKGCQTVFSYNPQNIRVLNKLLATIIGALSNDPFNDDVIIMELKKYEDMAKVVRFSDRSVGRAYSKELLSQEDLCDFCKNALPDDERCNNLFFTKRPFEHREKTNLILAEIERRKAGKENIPLVLDDADEVTK